jgi:iron complex outermembrane receptor protein
MFATLSWTLVFPAHAGEAMQPAVPAHPAPAAAHGETHPAKAHHPAAPRAVTLAPIEVKANATNTPRATSVSAYGVASLHDTPAAVTVIDRRQLDDRQVQTLSELARGDASLGDSYAPVGYYQDIAIRGWPLDPATGFRINDLTVTGEQIIGFEDKQQVEILKGLAGIDAGVMEPGGVVNYVAKRPADVRTLQIGTDSHGSRYAALDVGEWITPRFGVRVNAAWQGIHSYVQHADGRRKLFSIAVDWKLSPRATLELDGDYQADAQRSVSGYQLLGGTVIPPHADPTRMLGYEPWQQPVTIYSGNGSARLRYALADDWQLRLAAGHSRSVINDNVAFAYGCYRDPACADANQAFFAPNGNYDIWDFRSPGDTRSTDEVRATLAGHVRGDWVSQDFTLDAGVLHRTIHRRAEVFDDVGMANIDDVNPPFVPPSPSQPGAPAHRLDSWQRTLSALDRIHLGGEWQLLAGVQRAQLTQRTRDAVDVVDGDIRMRKWLPQAALLWQPDAALTAYLSYSEGLSLGKEAPYWTSNSGDTLAPRLSRQVEVGTKYQWSRSLALEAALFRIHQPYQFAEADASSAGYTFVERGQEVHTGVELSANGEATANLGVHASVALIEARATNTGVPAFEGHQVENVPRLRASVYLDYRLPWWPQWTLLGGWRYAAPNAATPDGKVRVPAYNVFDAGLRHRSQWRGHAVTWRLGVDNVFNRFYWRDTGSSGGDDYLFPGAPRLARLSVSVDW